LQEFEGDARKTVNAAVKGKAKARTFEAKTMAIKIGLGASQSQLEGHLVKRIYLRQRCFDA